VVEELKYQFDDGENWLAVNEEASLIPNRTHTITIEIIGDKASLYLDGEKIASAFFTTEIVRRGRVGLTKFWEVPIVTYSNIKIKTSNSIE